MSLRKLICVIYFKHIYSLHFISCMIKNIFLYLDYQIGNRFISLSLTLSIVEPPIDRIPSQTFPLSRLTVSGLAISARRASKSGQHAQCSFSCISAQSAQMNLTQSRKACVRYDVVLLNCVKTLFRLSSD